LINWLPEKNHHYGSKEGYRVSKQYTGETAYYTAWDNERGTKRKIIKAGCKSADAAKAECELFAMRNQK